MVLSLIIANPSAFSKIAGQELDNKSMNNFFLTGLMLLFAKPEESTKASRVTPLYNPELTEVAPLILMVYTFLISVVPLSAASRTKNVLSLMAAMSPIFQSRKRIWLEPEAPIIPSFK